MSEMNAQQVEQEGLSVVRAPFERQEGSGAAFPQFDGTVTGDVRLEGRLYDMSVEIKPRKKSLVLHLKHGPVELTKEIDQNLSDNPQAPGWQKTVEIGEYEYRVAAWLSWTKRDTRYLSFRFQRVDAVDDSLMDQFDLDRPQRQQSFIDDLNHDSREGNRDSRTEMEPDGLSGPGRIDQ